MTEKAGQSRLTQPRQWNPGQSTHSSTGSEPAAEVRVGRHGRRPGTWGDVNVEMSLLPDEGEEQFGEGGVGRPVLEAKEAVPKAGDHRLRQWLAVRHPAHGHLIRIDNVNQLAQEASLNHKCVEGGQEDLGSHQRRTATADALGIQTSQPIDLPFAVGNCVGDGRQPVHEVVDRGCTVPRRRAVRHRSGGVCDKCGVRTERRQPIGGRHHQVASRPTHRWVSRRPINRPSVPVHTAGSA